MAKGYGADATLVAAAYRLGQSYVPKDYTEIFKTQYQALADAHTAKMKMKADMWTATAGLVTKIGEHIKEEEKFAKEETDWLLGDDPDTPNAEKVATDWVTGQVNKTAKHFEAGGGYNPDLDINVNEKYLKEKKERFEELSKKSIFLSPKERKEKRNLRRQIEEFRGVYNKDSAEFSTAATMWYKDMANTGLSFKGEPELQMLWGQLMQYDTNFAEKGIRVFRDEKTSKKMVEYTTGRMGVEARSLSKEGDAKIPWVEEGSKDKKIISMEDLLKRVVPKNTKGENDANAIGTKFLEQTNKTVSNKDGVKVYSTPDFNSDVESNLQGEYYDTFMQTDNFADLATRTIKTGNTRRNYKEDLNKNIKIDEAIINQMGIGSDILTILDINNDGFINDLDKKGSVEEQKKHEDAKNTMIEILTNPKTISQKKIAAMEMAKYRTNQIKDVFETERARLEGAKRTETSKEKAIRLQAYEKNSLAIQTAFKAAEKKGFTLDNLQGLPIDKDKAFVEQDGKVYLVYKKTMKPVGAGKPINLKNKKQVLNILYQNSKIRATERNIKITSDDAYPGPYSQEYLNKFLINP